MFCLFFSEYAKLSFKFNKMKMRHHKSNIFLLPNRFAANNCKFRMDFYFGALRISSVLALKDWCTTESLLEASAWPSSCCHLISWRIYGVIDDTCRSDDAVFPPAGSKLALHPNAICTRCQSIGVAPAEWQSTAFEYFHAADNFRKTCAACIALVGRNGDCCEDCENGDDGHEFNEWKACVFSHGRSFCWLMNKQW